MKTRYKTILAALVGTTLGVVTVPALADPAPHDGQQVAHFDGRRGPPQGMRGAPHGPRMMHWKGGPHGPRFGGPTGGAPGMAVIVERFDVNGDGQITRDEVATVTAEKVSQFDADGDGQLSLEEYKALWTDQMNRMIVRSFQMHDPDGDAQVTLEEYSESSDRLFSRFDRDGDGVISKAEFGPPRGGDRPDGPPRGHGPDRGPVGPDEGPDGEPG